MMLVDADAVEAYALGKFELVEIVVIDLMAFHRIVEFARRRIDPHGFVFLLEVVRQVRIRHQVEPVKFHGAMLRLVS